MKIEIVVPDWLEEYSNTDKIFKTDEEKMEFVINIARINTEKGGGPFGAAIFNMDTGRVLSCGSNLVLQNNLSVLHAEVVAIMLAQKEVKSYSLSKIGKFELFSSSEPCAMCLGSILWSGLKRVVWGTPSEEARKIGFDEGPVFESSWEYLKNKGIDIKGGILKKKAVEILKHYSTHGIIYNP